MERLGPERCAMCYFRGHVFGLPCHDDYADATTREVPHYQSSLYKAVAPRVKALLAGPPDARRNPTTIASILGVHHNTVRRAIAYLEGRYTR